MSEPEFVNGLIVKAPHEKAPDFVKCAISIRREELITWLTAKNGDWINLDVKESKNGKWYAQVNDWKPENNPAEHHSGAVGQKNPTYTHNAGQKDEFSDDIPFMSYEFRSIA